MKSRLIALDGPLSRQSFPLDQPQVNIGRLPDNQIAIPDPLVSRRHCRLERLPDGRFQITDLDSRNGTFVSGLPVKQRTLQHGDQIKIGRSLFVFSLADEESPPGSSGIIPEDSFLEDRTLIRLQREPALFLSPAEDLSSPAPSTLPSQALAALLKISHAVHMASDLEALAGKLLALLSEAIPCEQGAVLLMSPGEAQPERVFPWTRSGCSEAPFGVLFPLVERALREGVALLFNDAPQASPESPPARKTVAVLVAPLFDRDAVLGAIYLSSYDPRIRLGKEHLQLAAAAGVFGGAALARLLTIERLDAENRRLQQEIALRYEMVGDGPAMQEVYRFIARVAPTDSTVLLCGESGTGKELVARAIHRSSPRASQPFVAINCAALTETLIESELFGHEKGAFTGAIAQKKGKLEVAHGGVAFLDEIGELPLSCQGKLLRVLQEREFERVGGTRPIRVDIRLIAATNRDLRAAVQQGRFRQDLFYRLNVVSITLPPLRDRREDIPLLASYFAARCGERVRRRPLSLSPEARECLMAYDWPGNVRELENAIEHAAVLGAADLIMLEDLPEAVAEIATPELAPGTYRDAVREQKKAMILNAIQKAGGSITEAARLLGVHPNYLHRLIRNLNLRSAIKSAGASL